MARLPHHDRRSTTQKESKGLTQYHQGVVEDHLLPFGRHLQEYQEEDFILPDEELPDGRLTYHEQQVLRNQQFRIKEAKRSLREEGASLGQLDRLRSTSFLESATANRERLYANGASTNLLGRQSRIRQGRMHSAQEAAAELAWVKAVVGGKPDRMRATAKMTPEDYGDESTLDYPKLGSLEEAREDLRLEDLERFYTSHGAAAAIQWSCKDRRMLRRWFNALDFDGSGEVSVPELQDPLISAGILKTRDQVYRVLLNADKNGTMGLDFKELLDALSQAKLANVDQLKHLQNMAGDGIFKMDTLVTAERRKKLINSICEQNQKRSCFFYDAFRDLVRTSKGRRGHTAAQRSLLELESRHESEKILHNMSVDSLLAVVEAKRASLQAEDDRIFRGEEAPPDPHAPDPDSRSPWQTLQDQHPQRSVRLTALNRYACYKRK